MGTSKSYGGPGKGLVPSWAGDPAPGTAPAGPPAPPPPPAPTGPGNPGVKPPKPGSSKPDTKGGGPFREARSNYSRFSRTGDRAALGRALSGYVQRGAGGSARASRRMGASRASGGRLLGVLRDIQQLGAQEVLKRLKLDSLQGRPAAEIFLALIEFLCPAGGAIDESIARQAMLDAICDLSEQGLIIDQLTPDQMSEFFIDYLIRSIEARVINDIGMRGITLPADEKAAANVAQQLHDFISGCTTTALRGELAGLASVDDSRIQSLTNELYEQAFELVSVAAEAEAQK